MKFDKHEIIEAIIEAAQRGGNQSVYLTNKGVFASNASQGVIEAGGTEVYDSFEVPSCGDMGYATEEEFQYEDGEDYLENLKLDIEID